MLLFHIYLALSAFYPIFVAKYKINLTPHNMRKILLGIFCVAAISTWGNPADDLLNRIDKGASSKFKTELVSSNKDFFEIDQNLHSKPIIIRGNSWVNIAVGINWYLKHYAGIHLSWNNLNVKLPADLPRVEKKERHETDLKLRYDFNYCTFSYSTSLVAEISTAPTLVSFTLQQHLSYFPITTTLTLL